MAFFEFNPTVEFVTLKFKCPECGNYNETDALSVPMPNLAAENHSDSCNYEDYEHICPICGHLFDITINNGMYGGDGEISDVEDGVAVEEDYSDYEDDYDEEYKSSFFDEHVRETIDVLDKIDSLDNDARKLLYRTLYANVISSLEAYLSDRLIQKVMSSKDVKRKFVEQFSDYGEQKISISDIFKQIDNLDSRIKKDLRDIIYHNLPRVRNMYKKVLNIDFGDVAELMRCIDIRHDIVHRNGKDKDGNLRDISKDDVITLAQKVSSFIQNIEAGFFEEKYSSIESPFD